MTALYTAQMPGSMPEGLHNYQIMFIVYMYIYTCVIFY